MASPPSTGESPITPHSAVNWPVLRPLARCTVNWRDPCQLASPPITPSCPAPAGESTAHWQDAQSTDDFPSIGEFPVMPKHPLANRRDTCQLPSPPTPWSHPSEPAEAHRTQSRANWRAHRCGHGTAPWSARPWPDCYNTPSHQLAPQRRALGRGRVRWARAGDGGDNWPIGYRPWTIGSAQRLVVTRPLKCLHDSLSYFRRLRRIHPRAN